jgi:hypothetical protein
MLDLDICGYEVKKKDYWISYMQNANIHGSPCIKHPVLGILEARVTPPSLP